jgi:hypothetical protein
MQEQLPRSKNLPPVRLDNRIGCRPERSYTCSEGPLFFYKIVDLRPNSKVYNADTLEITGLGSVLIQPATGQSNQSAAR